jgi:phenylacetate-CoA ligase
MDWRLQSALAGIAWPAVPEPRGAGVLALLHQLESSQWLPAAQLRALQERQLGALLRHAHASVPYYRRSLGAAFDAGAAATESGLAGLPLLTRRALIENYSALKSEALPPEHGATGEVRTSGSTGAPVRVLKTQLSQQFWNAITLRDHLWHKRDLGGKLAAIRYGAAEGETASWGLATAGLIQTGPSVTLGVDADVASQLDWLQRQQAQYVMTYPSIAAELATLALSRGVRLPGLLELRTFGEVLYPEARRLCREAFNAPVTDLYSSNEVGYIALQCPDSECYHVQSEALLVEVLDDRGRPCAQGEVGGVVVTDLHNFATPLIRYEIGDYAEVGGPCSCGRGLPVLSNIAGRVRNMLVTAEGKRYWPLLGSPKYFEIATILQHQLAQLGFDRLELRLVTAARLTAAQEDRLRALVLSGLPAGMRLELRYCDRIPRGAGGKFEDFVRELPLP